MTPLILLIVVLILPLGALLIQRLQSKDRTALQSLAREHEMHFAGDDRFKIAGKVAELLPIPGAANVHVFDVIYGKEGTRYHFIFSVAWVEGSVRWKRRMQRVASFSEETGDNTQKTSMQLRLAPENQSRPEQCRTQQSRVEQYKALYSNCCAHRKQGAQKER